MNNNQTSWNNIEIINTLKPKLMKPTIKWKISTFPFIVSMQPELELVYSLCGLNLHRTFYRRNFWVFHLCLFVFSLWWINFDICSQTWNLCCLYMRVCGWRCFICLPLTYSGVCESLNVSVSLFPQSKKMLSLSVTIGVLLFLSSPASVLLLSHKHETSIFFQTALRNRFFFHTMNDHSLKTCHWLLLEVRSHTFLFVVNRRQWIPPREAG